MTEAGETMTGVPMLDLAAQFKPIEADVRAAMERVLSTHVYINGPEVEALEREVLAYAGIKKGAAIGVSSGTDALLVALMALGVGREDEVITTPFTFFATAGVIHRLGAYPVFVDIRPDTFNIDPAGVRDAITERTKAIVPVHLFGRLADMPAILEAAGGIPVIEDAAQAIGAGHPDVGFAGSFGRAGCFSFFPSKNLGAPGDGGMVVTKDAAFGDRVRKLRQHGETKRYHHELVGGNFRLDAMIAAVLRVKLPHLDAWHAARMANAARYDSMLADAGLLGEHVLARPGDAVAPVHRENPVTEGDPALEPEPPIGRHIYNQYTLRVADRDGLIEHLRAKNVGCAIYYPVPMHLQPCFSYMGYEQGAFPEAERAASEVISLPIYPELTEAQQRYVVDAIEEFYKAAK
ncbi:DegT/DnrJ/EryC1/StrS family aminotransferase [bacterium]|nr:DegT/DnrJ/EryC1/StrS family aminotransferase [bacterium]